MRTGREWSRLSLEVFKTNLDKALSSLCDIVADRGLSWRLDDTPPEVPSKLNYPMILSMGFEILSYKKSSAE